MALTANEIIRTLRLIPHPEGVYFKETYRASGTVRAFGRKRNLSTAIYCLILKGSVSRLHRVRYDEMWHFYMGGPITIVEFSRSGKTKKTILGTNLRSGQRPQYLVPADTWFGAYPNPGTKFALVGCTVTPGFDFEDFEMGDRAALLRSLPRAKREILRLT